MSSLPQLWVNAMVYLFAEVIGWKKKAASQTKIFLNPWLTLERTFKRAIEVLLALWQRAEKNWTVGSQVRALTAKQGAFLVSLGLRNRWFVLLLMPLLRGLESTFYTGLSARLLAREQGYVEAMREVRLAARRHQPHFESKLIE